MQKSSVILVVMGGLVAGGLAMSAWGNHVLFEDFERGDGAVGAGKSLSVQVQMDGERGGVFAVEVIGSGEEGDVLHATVTDPRGDGVAMDRIAGDVHEGYFDADTAGRYTLTVESSGGQERTAAGYIGPEPDAPKRAVAFVSIYILIVGLAGMLAAIVYAAASKRRR